MSSSSQQSNQPVTPDILSVPATSNSFASQSAPGSRSASPSRNEQDLRKAIFSIQQDESLSHGEKTKRIQVRPLRY